MADEKVTIPDAPKVPDNKPDWIVASMMGKLKDTSMLPVMGMKTNDFNLSPNPKDYWSKNTIKQHFGGDEAKFKEFYDKETNRYKLSQKADHELSNFHLIDQSTRYSQKPSVGWTTDIDTEGVKDPWGRSRIGDYYSQERYGYREGAINRGAKLADGTRVSPKDYNGTLVLARKADGGFDLDENGEIYYRPLKKGEDIRSFDETYSKETTLGKTAEQWGMYGVKQTYLEEAGYKLANAIPDFLDRTGDALLEYGRQVETGTNKFGTQHNAFKSTQNKLRSGLSINSERAQDDWTDRINFMSMGVDMVQQLGSMALVSKVAGGLARNAQFGSIAGRMYMTAMSAGGIAQRARDAGLQPAEVAVLLGLNTFGIWHLSKLDDMVVNGIRPMQLAQKFEKEMAPVYGMLENTKGLDAATKKSFFNVAKTSMQRIVEHSISMADNAGKAGVAGFVGRTAGGMFLEGTEEVGEQLLDSSLRGAHDVLEPILPITGKFNWDASQEISGILQAGTFGALGGGLMHPVLHAFGMHDRENIQNLESSVAHNDEGFVFNMINKWEKAGRFGATKEDNQQKAQVWRKVLEAMVKIRDDAGLKNMISNNRIKAGMFADVLVNSSIARDKVVFANEKADLVAQLDAATKKQGSNPEEITRLTEALQKKQTQLDGWNKGLHVDKYISEALYNIHSNPLLTPKGKWMADSPDGFDGKLFTVMNEETIRHKPSLKDVVTKRNEKLTVNDANITPETYKLPHFVGSFTEAGRTNLVAQFNDRRTPFLDKLRTQSDAITKALAARGYGPEFLAKVFDTVKGVQASDLLEEIIDTLPPDQKKLAVGQPWFNDIKALAALDKEIRGVMDQEVAQPQSDISPDEWFMYDYEDGKSTMPLYQRLADEEAKAGMTKGTTIDDKRQGLYVSPEAARLHQVVQHRIAQVKGINGLNNVEKYGVTAPELARPQETLDELASLEAMFLNLKNLAERNAVNTEARLMDVYIQSLKKNLKTIRDVATTLASKNENLSRLIQSFDLRLQKPLEDGDHIGYRKTQLELETALYKEFGSQRTQILQDLTNYEDADIAKSQYDYMRGVLSSNPAKATVALRNLINAIPKGDPKKGEPNTPSREQQAIMHSAIMNAFAGEYKWMPTQVYSGSQPAYVAMSFSTGINGGAGTGKSTVIIPGIAHMVNSMTEGKVIVTATKDTGNAKRNKVQNDLEQFFQGKPDFVKYSDQGSLIDILNSQEVDDVTGIVFDEAGLLSINELRAIDARLNSLNADRIAAKKIPLHIFYTYDSFQNSYHGPKDLRSSGINTDNVNIPETPRMSYSFRSVNSPLKAVEETFRLAQQTDEEPSRQVFEHDGKGNGVLFVNSKEDLEKELIKIAEREKLKNGNVANVAYINANGNTVGVPAVASTGVFSTTSMEAQGREWDYGVVDSDGDPFKNDLSKQEMYTAVTRFKKGVVVFVNPNVPLQSIKGVVREFTPVLPAAQTKIDVLDEIDKVIGENINDGKYEGKDITFSKMSRNLPPIPPPSSTVEDGPLPEDEDAKEKNVVMSIISQYAGKRKGKEPVYATMNTFFNVRGQSPTAKKAVLFDPDVRNNSQYWVTVARINSKGYEFDTEEINHEFDDKYGIFIEAKKPDGEVVLLGTMSKEYGPKAERTTQMLRDAGVINDSSPDVVFQQNVDKKILTEAWGYHPFVQNNYSKDGKFVRSNASHTLTQIKNEAVKNGVGISPVLIATDNFVGKNNKSGDGEESFRINKGDPFMILSYRHTDSELRTLASQGKVKVDSDDIATLTLRGSYFSIQDVVDVLTPYIGMDKDGHFSLPKRGDENYFKALGVYNSLWQDSDKLSQAYEQALHQLIAEGDQQAVAWDAFNKKQKGYIEKNGVRKSISNGYNVYFLLKDVIGGMGTKEAKVRAKTNFEIKNKILQIMLASDLFKNGFKFSPAREISRGEPGTKGRLGTGKAAYILAEELPHDFGERAYSARYHKIEPPKVQVPINPLMAMVTGGLVEQGPATQSGTTETPEGKTELTKGSKVRPTKMNFNLFQALEFPNDPQSALRAIDQFKKMVINSHLNLEVSKGQQPSIAEVGDIVDEKGVVKEGRMKKLRNELLSEVNRDGAGKNLNRKIDYAIGRNFEGLLANYFPAITYDSSTDTFAMDNTVYKTETFSEQSEENLLTHGITSLVRTYLFTTPMPNRKYFNERHIASLVPLFRGLDTDSNDVNRTSPHTVQKIEELLRKSNLPEAKAILDRFFSSKPIDHGSRLIYSTRAVESNTGQSLTTAMAQFFMKAERYLQGFTEIQRRGASDEFGSKDIVDSRSTKYPTGPFAPSYVTQSFISGWKNIMRKAGKNKSAGPNSAAINGQSFDIKKDTRQITVSDAVRMLHTMGLTGVTEPIFQEFLSKEPTGMGIVQDYFFRSLKDSHSDPTITEPFNRFLTFYAEETEMGNGLSFIDMDNKRQNMLRTTAPVFHIHNEVTNIRKAPLSVLHNNLLVKGSEYTFSLNNQPFVNSGVKVTDERGERRKSMEKMSASELLDIYAIDGFIAPVLKGEKAVSFPVTVYSDNGTELTPIFQTSNPAGWISDSADGGAGSVVNKLFDSRAQYMRGLEQIVLAPYVKNWDPAFGDVPSDLNQLQAALASIPVELKQQFALKIQSSPDAVSGLHYDEVQMKVLNPVLKQNLIDDRNTYMNEKSREEFKNRLRQEADALIEASKVRTSAPKTLYEKIEKMSKTHSPDKLIKNFYVNWLAMSTEFQKMMNGTPYQYKKQGGDAYIDMVKRSRSLTSPAGLFVLRNENWATQVAEFRAANPGKPLPVSLMYEGSKLSSRSKIFQITDPEQQFRSYSHGGAVSNKIFDGATFVTPFTRIKQDYSTALTYGPFVGPVMKNVTHYNDPVSGTKGFIKNAEFEITPEILRRGDDFIKGLFTQMVGPVGMDALRGAGVAEDFSNIERKHFIDSFPKLVEAGQQDELVDEAVFQSSHKTGSRGVNQVYADPATRTINPALVPSYINIEMKGIQQDAMKDPSEGLDTKVLTQLVQAIATNWINDVELKSFYNNLSEISKRYIDKLAGMDPEKRKATYAEIMRRDLLEKDGVNYRTDAAAKNLISINDRSMSPLYLQTISSELKNMAVAFKLRGGQYVMHPGTFIEIYDVEGVDAQGKPKRYTAFRDQIANLKSGKVVGGPRQLKYTDPKRVSDGKGLSELFAALPLDAKGKANPADVAAIHKSLETEEWTQGEAEVLLPAEMGKEFFLDEAIANNMALGEIDTEYFLRQILSENDKAKIGEHDATPARRRQAEMINEAFQKRISGILARIPTSGKHSAVSIRIAGFMNESMNSVFAPPQLLDVQGADQDIDKGSYLTYRSIVKYAMVDPNIKKGRITKTYNPDALEHRHLVKVGEPAYTGLVPLASNLEEVFQHLPAMNDTEKAAIERIAMENELVRSLQAILNDPKSIKEANTSSADVLKPLEDARDRILAGMDAKSAYNMDSMLSLLKIHEENQAGGKGLTGIFANGAKAYNVLYIMNKLTGENKLAGLTGENNVWNTYAGFIGATVDNANIMALGPMKVDETAAPFVSYLISTGSPQEEIEGILATHANFFEAIRQSKRYDRQYAFDIENKHMAAAGIVTPELKALYYKTLEYNVLSKALVNRDIPVRMEEIASYLLSLERFVNLSYRDAGITEKFDVEQFMSKNEQYRNDHIAIYERLPQDRHTYNILQVFRDVPHMAQYQRALFASHMQAKDIKAYNLTFQSQRKPIGKKDKTQYYFYNTDNFGKDYDFVHGLFIDAYLKGVDVESITDHDLSSPDGRAEFIADFNNELGNIKSQERSKDNKLIKELRLDVNQKTGDAAVVLNDYYDMSEDRKALYMQEMKRLDPVLRGKLFLYNLITSREKNSKGSLTSFFSADDKLSYLNFIDKIDMDPKAVQDAFQERDKDAANSKEEISQQSIPYSAEFGINAPLGPKSYDYKGLAPTPKTEEARAAVRVVPVYKSNKTSIDLFSPAVYRVTGRDADGTFIKGIGIDKTALAREYANKRWANPLPLSNGTFPPVLPESIFSSEAEYEKFLTEVAYLAVTGTTSAKKAYATALEHMGKDWTPPVSEKQNKENAENCGLKPGAKMAEPWKLPKDHPDFVPF